MVDLVGRRALVTGASRNLGASIAERLAAAGAGVAVNYRSSRSEAEAVVEALGGEGSDLHIAVGGDVGDEQDVASIVETSSHALGGPIDVLVNNAGPYDSTPLGDIETERFDRVLDTGLKGAYLLSRAVATAMREQGWGRIVNVSASSAYVRNRSVYTLANDALITLTEQLAVELSPHITVNAIAPGQIEESLDELRALLPDWAERVVAVTPLQRLATRVELAELVVLFCSPMFDSVTGTTIRVDGGLSLNTF